MAYLGNAPARSFISFERQVFTIVNSQTAYTLDHSVNNENDIRLVVNNIVQEPGSGKAYTASGTTLTLSAALTNGTDEMYCVFLGRATATNAPGAGSVGASQLASDAVTAAKLNDDIISGQTALGATPADTDEFLISDAGTIKRVDYSYLKGGTNTPAFSANQTSGTISASLSTWTKLVFDNELYDTASAYDTSNGRFTVPSGEGGKYSFSAHLAPYEQSNNNMTGENLGFYKNGSLEIYVPYQYSATTGTYKGTCITADLNLSAGDYVEFYFRMYASSGTARAEVGASFTRFSGFKLIE